MGPDTAKHVRNIAIIIGLALAVWLLPGGQSGSQTVSNLLSVILLGGLCFLAYRMYRENRVRLLDMDDRRRAMLYGAFALATFAVVATGRLWETGPGALVWLMLIGLAGYGVYAVVRAEREY